MADLNSKAFLAALDAMTQAFNALDSQKVFHLTFHELIAECLPAGIDAFEKEIERARDAFKAYVHKRFDIAGIPTHPEGVHSQAGCRVGDRLDIALASLTSFPIDTAPRDGRIIWLLSSGEWVLGRYYEGAWEQRGRITGPLGPNLYLNGGDVEPTHWLPTPVVVPRLNSSHGFSKGEYLV